MQRGFLQNHAGLKNMCKKNKRWTELDLGERGVYLESPLKIWSYPQMSPQTNLVRKYVH
jgi:hypothetical protein